MKSKKKIEQKPDESTQRLFNAEFEVSASLDIRPRIVASNDASIQTIYYSHLSDEELNNIVDVKINKGPIPLRAVLEHQKRFPKRYTKKIKY